MARITPDGYVQVYAVNTITTPSSPTWAEITAGTALHGFLTPTGLDTPEEGQDADSSDLGSARDKSIPATVGGDVIGEFYRDDGTGGSTDDAWDALPRNLDTNLVIARFGGSGTSNAISSGDAVEVIPVRVSQRSNNRMTRGEALRFTARFAVKDDFVNATVTST